MNSNIDITTDKYRIQTSLFITIMLRLTSALWLSIIVAMVILTAVLAVLVDLRFIIIAAMVIFILAPMVLAFLYIYYGLSADCYINILEHKIRFTTDKITITTYKNNCEDSDEFETVKSDVRCYHRAEFDKVKFIANGIVYVLKSKPKGFLYIPFCAIENNADLNKLVEYSFETINKKKKYSKK